MELEKKSIMPRMKLWGCRDCKHTFPVPVGGDSRIFGQPEPATELPSKCPRCGSTNIRKLLKTEGIQ